MNIYKKLLYTNCVKQLLFGVLRRGNKPLVLPGVGKGFSKAKMGELKASPKKVDNKLNLQV